MALVMLGSINNVYAADDDDTSSEEVTIGFELTGQYPQVLGEMGQGFKGLLGGTVKMFLPGFLGELPGTPFVMSGYQGLRPLALSSGQFSLVPIVGGIEMRSQSPLSSLWYSWAGGIGGTFGWINVPASAANNFRVSSYFTVYIEPSLLFEVSENIYVRMQMPLNFLIGNRLMQYMAWGGGVRVDF